MCIVFSSETIVGFPRKNKDIKSSSLTSADLLFFLNPMLEPRQCSSMATANTTYLLLLLCECYVRSI